MALLTNLSFEAGSGGTPTGWTLTSQSSVEALDTLASGGVVDGFETGWGNSSYEWAFTDVGGTATFSVDPTLAPTTSTPHIETFEQGWDHNEYYELGFSGSTAGVDGFETGWGNSEYEWAFEDEGGTAIATADLTDGFETGWGNTSYLTTLPISETASLTGNSAPDANGAHANFYGVRALTVETFEYVLPDIQIIGVNTTDGELFINSAIDLANYGLSDNLELNFYSVTGALPGGISVDTLYRVGDAEPGGFFIENFTLTGEVIPTDQGSGLFYATFPYQFWTQTISL